MMNIKKAVMLVLVASLFWPVFASGQAAAPAGKYDKWLNEEVSYIISPGEREVFGALTEDRDRDLFIEEFWKQRDPTPGTPENELRTEHYRRIDYVNKRFNAGPAVKGWQTDRGRTLIILGPPLDVQRFASADTAPLEIWYYLTDLRCDLPTYFRLLFFQEYGADESKLYNPAADGPKRLVPFPDRWRPSKNVVPGEAAAAKANTPASWTPADQRAYEILVTYVTSEAAEASISCFPGFSEPGDVVRSAAMIEGIPTLSLKRIDDSYAREFLKSKAPAEVSYSVHPVECRSAVAAVQDASGGFSVSYALGPRALAIDYFDNHYFAGVRTTIRVTDAGGKPAFQDVRFTPVELSKTELKAVSESSPEIHGSFALGPGAYTVDILLENTVSKDFAAITKKISIPPDRNAKGPVSVGAVSTIAEKPSRSVWIITQ
jgi:GWxTD domain-containing protein